MRFMKREKKTWKNNLNARVTYKSYEMKHCIESASFIHQLKYFI